MPARSIPAPHLTNPFATRHTRPGRLPPLDETGRPRDVPALVATLAGLPAAAIVGPHGTGKSTLLRAVELELAAAGRSAGIVQLRQRSDLLTALAMLWRAGHGSVLGVDGWERLGRTAAAAVRLLASARGVRLLVTTHRPAWMPTVASTAASLSLLEAVVARLPDHGGLVGADDLAETFARHAGNLREALAELYDRFEHRARRS
ncbi:MAG: hypothetical protein ACKOCX_03440 [Planctomycetota bacterium]